MKVSTLEKATLELDDCAVKAAALIDLLLTQAREKRERPSKVHDATCEIGLELIGWDVLNNLKAARLAVQNALDSDEGVPADPVAARSIAA